MGRLSAGTRKAINALRPLSLDDPMHVSGLFRYQESSGAHAIERKLAGGENGLRCSTVNWNLLCSKES